MLVVQEPKAYRYYERIGTWYEPRLTDRGLVHVDSNRLTTTDWRGNRRPGLIVAPAGDTADKQVFSCVTSRTARIQVSTQIPYPCRSPSTRITTAIGFCYWQLSSTDMPVRKPYSEKHPRGARQEKREMSDEAEASRTMQLFRLDKRIALVSGGAGIYGRYIVQALAEAGAKVVVASRNLQRCRDFAGALQREKLCVESAELDLASETSIRALRGRILDRHGQLDILVNNAVARVGGDLRHINATDWEAAMKVNSTGLFLSCQIFSEPMQQAHSGSIINIASIYGMVGPDFSIYEDTNLTNPVNYAFAKGGMISLTRYLASFLAPYNVRVNCLSPGGFRTEDTPEHFISNYSRRTPLRRMAEPDDIKGPIVFFASEASRYVTGQNLAVDGGWTAI